MPEIMLKLPDFNNKLSKFIIQKELLFLIKLPIDAHEKAEELSFGCLEILRSHGWTSPGRDLLNLRYNIQNFSQAKMEEFTNTFCDDYCFSELFAISESIIIPESQILSTHTAPEYNTRCYQDLLTSLTSRIPQKTFIFLVKATGIMLNEENDKKEKKVNDIIQLLLSIPLGYEFKTHLESDLHEMAFLYFRHKYYDILPYELAYHMNWLQKLDGFSAKIPKLKKKYKYPHPGYWVLQMLRVAFLFMCGNPEDAMRIGQKFIDRCETMLVPLTYTRQHVLFLLGVMSMEAMETQQAVRYMSESKKCCSGIFSMSDLINQFQIN